MKPMHDKSITEWVAGSLLSGFAFLLNHLSLKEFNTYVAAASGIIGLVVLILSGYHTWLKIRNERRKRDQ